ncbi:MAG: hypothetical protein JO227_06360 [Acetobacteraceae bacterium]|nr:hypothetical protein [Acetobacteraceae bacterium]
MRIRPGHDLPAWSAKERAKITALESGGEDGERKPYRAVYARTASAELKMRAEWM